MQVEAEVSRLEALKSSKLKELVLKKRTELGEICRKTHIIPVLDGETENLIEAIESGNLLLGFLMFILLFCADLFSHNV